jgi:hypothetical protein
MKARAAAARVRKKLAGTRSTRAAVKRLAEGTPSGVTERKNVQQGIRRDVIGKRMSKKKARKARSALRGTQSQTHRAVH